MDSKSIKSAGEILKSLLSEKQNEEAREYYRFFSAWDEIVGENLAGRTRAKELKGKTLIVEVDHPGWIQVLQMRQAYILHELGERFSGLQIEKIRCYVSGEPGGPEEPGGGQGGTEKSSGQGTVKEPADSPKSGEGVDKAGAGAAKKEKEEKEEKEGDESAAERDRLDSALRRLGQYINKSGVDRE